jgi:THO complex subunit 2
MTGMTVIERLHAFTQLVVGDSLLVSTALAAQLLDAAQFVALGLAPSTAAFNKKVVRQNTKDSYTQRKYNLLREESEGFAKLFARLAEDGALGSPDAVLHTARTVQSLIGYFDLDPNRVFDVALDALEQLPLLADMHRPLLALFKPSALSQVLGFKFQLYHAVGTFAVDAGSAPSVTPASLYRLAAQLIALGALDRRRALSAPAAE